MTQSRHGAGDLRAVAALRPLWHFQTSLLSCDDVGLGLPSARAGREDGVCATAVVRNTRGGADACTSERDKVLRGKHVLSKLLNLLVELLRRVEKLHFLFFSLVDSVSHVFNLIYYMENLTP